jgi:hypothetical protein
MEVLDLSQEGRALAPALGAFSPALVRTAIETWRGRMVNEHSSAHVFEQLSLQLEQARFPNAAVAACRQFAREERKHGVLCAAVVCALGGEAQARLDAAALYPAHRDARGRAAALRNLIHVCCMSETVAVSLIGAERLQMPDGPLRELLTEIYADEVGHARFGWRLLEQVAPELDPFERQAIERYLPVAFAHLEHHELAHLPNVDAPPSGEQLGLCSGLEARQLFYDTVDSVIRPGLRRWFTINPA